MVQGRSMPALATMLTAILALGAAAGADEARVDALLAQMTLEEKVLLLGGTGFATEPIARLGIPPLEMTDGPNGIRDGRATSFPVGIAMGATWNPELIAKMGGVLAEEALAKRKAVLLGPMLNLIRNPFGGRNFETFSEDPHLTGEMAVAYVRGVQARGVAATPKHLAVNNQEHERMTISMEVDERTLREVYLPAFRRTVVEAKAWTVMSAYNRLNGLHCSDNHHLQQEILKDDWGFDGLLMSDWGATHSVAASANAGLDLEMPGPENWGEGRLLAAVRAGEVAEVLIDDKVRRILRTMDRTGVLDGSIASRPGALDTPEHRAIALEVATESAVLLKNEKDALPLDAAQVASVAIIGPNAAVARTGGGGSSRVTPIRAVSPLQGIRALVGDRVDVVHAPGMLELYELPTLEGSAISPGGDAAGKGFRAEYFANRDFEGEPAFVRTDAAIDFDWAHDGPKVGGIGGYNYSVRWTAKLTPATTGIHHFEAASDDGTRLYVDGKLLVDNWGNHAVESVASSIALEAGKTYELRLDYYQAGGGASVRLGWLAPEAAAMHGLEAAVAAAKDADAAIVFCGLSDRHESEGRDVPLGSLALPAGQDELIAAVAKANPRTIVVLNGGNPCNMQPWLGDVPAVMQVWYQGQEGGHAVARLLFGASSPSGRLPITFPRRWEDCGAYGSYPGENGRSVMAEGLHIGYRHFEKNGTEPLFAFGHGLTYTHFAYSNMTTAVTAGADAEIVATFEVQNAGPRAGSEVAQLYLGWIESPVERPAVELRAFEKIAMAPGETRKVVLRVPVADLAWYDAGAKAWKPASGTVQVLVGPSVRQTAMSAMVELPAR